MKTIKFQLRKRFSYLALFALLGATVYSCKCDKKVDRSAAEDASAAAASSAAVANSEKDSADTNAGQLDENGNYVYNTGDDMTINFKDGSSLTVGDKSTEAKLYNRLTGDYVVPSKDNLKSEDWMVMDRVYFESGGAALTAESQNQVDNIAKLMNEYPNAKLNIGGYTDNTGSDETNLNVSAKRAATVLEELAKKGVAKDRLSSQGFGSKFPVCPANDTPECKAQNRRVDILLIQK